jgi:hypothetical protein
MAMTMAKLFDIAAPMVAMAKNEDKFLKRWKDTYVNGVGE